MKRKMKLNFLTGSMRLKTAISKSLQQDLEKKFQAPSKLIGKILIYKNKLQKRDHKLSN